MNSNNLGWALPTGNTWGTYATQFHLPEATSLGDTRTLYCLESSDDYTLLAN